MHYEYNANLTKRKLVDEDTGEVLAEEIVQPDYKRGAQIIADAMTKAMPLFKTPWNHDTDAASDASGTACPEIGKTVQSEKDAADINYIVNQVLKTGQMPPVPMPHQFGSYEEMDFQDAMNTILAGKHAFEALPQEVRRKFNEDPAKFLAYCDHCMETGDLDPLRELGLALPSPVQTPETPKDGRSEGGPVVTSAPPPKETAAAASK